MGGEIIHLKEMACLIRAVSRNNCHDNFDNVSRKHLNLNLNIVMSAVQLRDNSLFYEIQPVFL